MNKVFLRGNVGKDPQIKRFENGGMIAQFSLATTERGFTTKEGREVPEETTWHNIVVKQSGLASVCEKYVKKGSQLLVCGKIKTREYKDNAGQTRYVTEIFVEEMELIGNKQDGNNAAAPAPAPAAAPAAAPASASESDQPSDDLPF